MTAGGILSSLGQFGADRKRPRATAGLTPAQLARRVRIGEERRAKTRTVLIEAAFRVFAERGLEAPSIDDVIAEAGLSRGTFYNHFSTREALAEAVAGDIATDINRHIRPAIQGIEDPAERIATAFRLFARFAVSDASRGWVLVRMMPLMGGPLNAEMRQFVFRDFSEGVARGRLHALSVPIAVDLGMGLVAMTVRSVLAGQVENNHIDLAAEMLLRALGVSGEEAAALARLPLPAGTPESSPQASQKETT